MNNSLQPTGRLSPQQGPVSLRALNRWTLARQHLLERAPLGPLPMIEHLGGLQAQHSPSPYIGIWSRVREFDRADLEAALLEDRVLKATLMRGTLHLVTDRQYPAYRTVIASRLSVYSDMVKRLRNLGVDVDAVREQAVARLCEGPIGRLELRRFAAALVPPDLEEWAGYAAVATGVDLISGREDGLFGRFAGTSYRLGPEARSDPTEAWRHVVAAYLRAFGPATRGDLAQWSGEPVSAFATALDSLDLLVFEGVDGRRLLDLPDAPRPGAEAEAPVRFLPKWDNVLLAYERRQRVLPEALRKIAIRKNGDVLPTFLVDGFVAGSWDAPLRGRAVMTLTALQPIGRRDRAAVEAEGEALLAWLRPDTDRREVRWSATAFS